MSEILTIRLNNDPDESIPWLVWSTNQQEIIAAGDVENLFQLSAYAKDREVVVLADSAAITLTSVAIPPGSERQLENILPFLLEDDLAQDVSLVHVSLLEKRDGIAYVAIIENKMMQSWLASLSQAHLNPKRIVPDCLCLPKNDDAFSAVFLHERWIVRTGQAQGFSAEDSWLPILLQSMQEQQDSPLPNIVSYSGTPEDAGENWHTEPAELIMELLVKGSLQNNYSLLNGRYKPNNQYSKYMRYWRNAGIAAALFIATVTAESVVNLYQIEGQTKQIYAETLKQAKTVLPNKKNIPTISYLKRVLDDELSRLLGAGGESGLLAWLQEIAPMLKSAPGIHLDTLRYDQERGELRFNASGQDFTEFEKLRAAFSAKFKTELGSLNRDDKSVTGAFVLQKES